MAQALLLTTQKFFEKSIIDNNVDSDLITKLILRATQINVYNILGTDLFNKIVTDAGANTITGYYKTLLDDYIQDFIVYWVEYYSYTELNYKLTNKSVAQKSSDNSTPTDYSTISKIEKTKKSLADDQGKSIYNYIMNNLAQFPEYQTVTENYSDRPKRSYSGAIWLGLKKGCS